MKTLTPQSSDKTDQRAFQRVNKLLIAWMSLVAVVLIGMTAMPIARPVAVPATPKPHYTYCTKEWRENQLPASMWAIFEDWCEHRPGR